MKHIIKNDLKIKKEELTSEVTRVKALLINSNNEIEGANREDIKTGNAKILLNLENGVRKEYDINIEGKKYSLKSSTSKEMQISTLSDNNKNRIYFDKDILQATTLSAAYIRTLINSYGLEDFIFGFVSKNKIMIGMFSVSNFLNLIDNVKLVQKETHRPLCLYDKNNNLIAEIKDDTGKPKANAFQRGLWIKNLNLVEKAGVFYDTVELDASEMKTSDLINLFK